LAPVRERERERERERACTEVMTDGSAACRYFDDLESLDADLYRNLMWTKKYTGDYADLALNFEVTENVLGSAVSTELFSGGKDVPVTANNIVSPICCEA
jgi:hypothetical protein